MGNVERVDKTLAVNEMVFYVRKDPELRRLWQENLKSLADRFGLTTVEYDAVKASDVKRMMEIGVHQYLIPHILRLTYGVGNMTNDHPALVAYQKAFPEESKNAIGGTIWDRTEIQAEDKHMSVEKGNG
jgi:predicted mannosyl-3-phosphoglycerate phosphatase (HAD superfamily)